MKVYKKSHLIAISDPDEFHTEILKEIQSNTKNKLESEIYYSQSNGNVYSALILAYTEE